jgi:hypothetical protein
MESSSSQLATATVAVSNDVSPVIRSSTSSLVPTGTPSPETPAPSDVTVRNELYWCDIAGRPQAEAFVKACFQRHHSARIHVHYSRLLVMQGEPEDGHSLDIGDVDIHAVTGLMRADEGPLRVEAYLGVRIETLLADTEQRQIERHQIMEIGALCSATAGAGRMLMLALVEVLASLEVEWLVVTASREVRNGLSRLGIAMRDMGKADPTCLDSQDDWGSYYAHDPRVVVIRPLDEAQRMGSCPLGRRLLAGAPRFLQTSLSPFPAFPTTNGGC